MVADRINTSTEQSLDIAELDRVVDEYLKQLEKVTTKKRGRKPNLENLRNKRNEFLNETQTLKGLPKLNRIAKVHELDARITALSEDPHEAITQIEAQLAPVIKKYSLIKGFYFEDWLALGVPTRLIRQVPKRSSSSAYENPTIVDLR